MAVDPAAPSEVLAVAASVTKEFPTHPVEVAAVAPSTDPVVQLLKENHTHEAVAWIVEKLEALPARDAIDVLGVWLARPTTTASSTPTTSGAAAAQPSPQPSAQPATPAPLPSSTGALAL